jgi:hypothetical protein
MRKEVLTVVTVRKIIISCPLPSSRKPTIRPNRSKTNPIPTSYEFFKVDFNIILP